MILKYFELYRNIFLFYLVLSQSRVISCYLRLSRARSSNLCLSLAIHCCPWLFLAILWYIMLSCVISGHLLLSLGISIKYLVSGCRQKFERASYGSQFFFFFQGRVIKELALLKIKFSYLYCNYFLVFFPLTYYKAI